MKFLNSPIKKDDQHRKLIEDTEEIINNFRQISAIIVDKLNDQNHPMYHLGKKLINHREEQNNSEDDRLII